MIMQNASGTVDEQFPQRHVPRLRQSDFPRRILKAPRWHPSGTPLPVVHPCSRASARDQDATTSPSTIPAAPFHCPATKRLSKTRPSDPFHVRTNREHERRRDPWTRRCAKKLRILADAAKYDASCASSGAPKRKAGPDGLGSTTGAGICHAYTPDGRCVSLLKILLTNYCLFDCAYCVNRRSSNVRRARFTVEEVVTLTIEFYKRNYIEGLFLSSGIIRSPDYTMEQMMLVAKNAAARPRLSRLHPSQDHPRGEPVADRAGRAVGRPAVDQSRAADASRAWSGSRRRRTAPRSRRAMAPDAASASRRRARSAAASRPPGRSTQMIVGADATTDADVLRTSATLYGNYELKRVYYSAFSPIPDSSAILPLKPPPLQRENRLYQADWLLRYYGFAVDEIAAGGESGMLDLDIDPKLAWALKNRDRFPGRREHAPTARCCCASRASARGPSTRSSSARRHTTLRLDDVARLTTGLKRARAFPDRGRSPPERLARSRATCASASPTRPRAAEPVRMTPATASRLERRRRSRRLPPARCAGCSPRQRSPPDASWSCDGGRDARPVRRRRRLRTRRRRSRLPRASADLIELVVCHRDPERYALLYG